MESPRRAARLGRFTLLAVLVTTVLAVPAATVPHDNTRVPYQLIEHMSAGVVSNYWATHPEEAPPRVADFLSELREHRTPPARHVNSCTDNANRDVFNCDIFGLPQNEESMAACPTNDDFVLEGTNDYRGLIDPRATSPVGTGRSTAATRLRTRACFRRSR